MPYLIVPKFRTAEAIRADKIDRLVAMFARALNGGLDARSLADSLTLGNAQFREPFSLAAVRASFGTNSGGGGAGGAAGVVPFAGYLLGASVVPDEKGPDERTVTVNLNGASALSFKFRGDTRRARRVVSMLAAPVVFSAGARFEATVSDYPAVGPDRPDAHVTVLLAVLHQA